MKASVIAVEIVYYNFGKREHQGTLLEPTNITNEIYHLRSDFLKKCGAAAYKTFRDTFL